MPKKCYFTTDLSEMLSCSKDGKFDDYGIPISGCSEFPCEKYKGIVKEVEDNIRRYSVTADH